MSVQDDVELYRLQTACRYYSIFIHEASRQRQRQRQGRRQSRGEPCHCVGFQEVAS